MFHEHRTPTYRNQTYFTAPVRIGGRVPDLYLATLGRFSTNGRFNMQQVSPTVAVHVVRAGQGVMRIGDHAFEVGAGDLFAFFPGWHVRYHDRVRSPWRYTWFVLGGDGARDALASAGLTERSPHRHAPAMPETLEPIFREVMRLYSVERVAATFAVAAAWRLIDGMNTCADVDAVETSPSGVAARARFLVDHSYMRLNGVRDIAAHVGVSRATLFRQFRAVYRMSPKQYLDEVRLGQARQLLRAGELSIKEVAIACGYHDAHYFSRAFKKHHQSPPSRWQ